ncbi:MAG TPA: hypothetical protein IAC57_00125 [Candidatus Scatosoma pullistercoris]|uniref:Uncharacterized protein n=1 Tax=Candidatus Scatosoma pullistercoris TaxID=2840934 RepID=A0A9D1MEB6_9FIRM|nr:hypothetical protein [Candidatus Scatosoma pullistercoris]
MTDYGNNNQKQTPSHAYANVPPRGNETALMIEGLYNGLSYDLQKVKKELMNELKYNALQASSLYQSVQKETESSVETNAQTAQSMVRELKYGYQQNQMIYESLSGILKDDVLTKLETVEGKVELLEEIDKALAEIKEKLDELASRTTPDYESLVDYDKITETVIEKTESSIASHNKEVLDAVAAIPVAENIDYTRIVEEVSEKVAELVRDGRTAEATAVPADVDYERIVYGTAEKVVESLPYPEKVDYRRIDENFIKAAESIKPAALDEEVLAANIAAAVAQAISEMDPETLAEAVASKIALPEVQAPEIDYEKLSDMIIAKMPAPADPEPIDYDRLADAVAARMSEAVDYDRISETVAERTPQPEEIDYAVMAQNIVEQMPQPEAIDYAVMAQSIVEQMPQPEEIDYAVMAQNIAERMPQAEAIDYDRVYQAAKAAEVIPDPVDYDRIAEIVEAGMSNESDYDIVVDEEGAEKIARCVADGIDYKGISEMVTEGIDYKGISDKVTEGIDYEGLSEKVVEKIVMPEVEVPKPEEIDYDLLSEMVAQKVVVPQPEPPTYDVVVDEEGAKSIAENVVSAIDMESVTDKVAEKIVVPQPEQIEIDYETLSDKVAEKIVVPQPEKTEIDYETLSDEVAGKISLPAFDILVDEEGAGKIADAVVEKMKAECPMSEKAAAQEEVAEEAQTEAAEEAPAEAEEISETAEESVAEEAAEEVCEEVAEEAAPAVEEPAEAVEEAEPVAEEVAEEAETVEEAPVEEIPVEEIPVEEEVAAEETAATEEPAEEPVEETAPEELLSEGGEIVSSSQSTIETEIAVTTAEAAAYEEAEGDNLVDADTGLVIRLKRSFTAKMKQSDPAVKQYYSDIKNELTSYKRLNSNLSWHGDRFNFGRDTVAKLNICGKTLCFYLALDPNDPEYKTTVYHQKDVGGQRAYESTPFMVKVKSDAGLKKALRLVGFLAEKLGTEKRDNFETVDYVEEFRHESTKQLLEEGLIKVTKEKKVVLDFN